MLCLFFFQNVPIIFFSAAKPTNEHKTLEEKDETLNLADVSDSEDTVSIESEEESYIDNKEALESTEKDIEIFQKQLNQIDKSVTDTEDRITRIQLALDKVVESLRLGKPIETVINIEQHKVVNEQVVPTKEVDTEKIENSHEIYDRNRLLSVLKSLDVECLKNPPRLSVGMIGYPNVGKSSTVNVLMQTKKVNYFY